LFRFDFLEQKPVQTSLAWFFCFWLGFARFFFVLLGFFLFGSILARFFLVFWFGFGLVWLFLIELFFILFLIELFLIFLDPPSQPSHIGLLK
jgi:hypothetical protein